MSVVVEPGRAKQFSIGPINTNPYPAHLHNVVETVVLKRGVLNMTVNGTLYCLEPGTAIMVFPGVPHSYENASEDAGGLFVGFDPGLISEFHSVLIKQIPVVPMVRIGEKDRELKDAIDKLERFSHQEGTHPLTKAYIHLFVACIIMKMQLMPAGEDNGENNLRNSVVYYLREHYMENLTLDSVAREMGIGKSHLSHLFSEKLRINFRQYLNTIRIERACQLLQEPAKSIKEVCFECGFFMRKRKEQNRHADCTFNCH